LPSFVRGAIFIGGGKCIGPDMDLPMGQTDMPRWKYAIFADYCPWAKVLGHPATFRLGQIWAQELNKVFSRNKFDVLQLELKEIPAEEKQQ